MTSSIIQQPPLRLLVAKSENFPEGNRAAFNSLESHLKTLRGRRFYGLIYETENGIDYYAALAPDNQIEERRFVELGFELREVSGGPCARIKLLDWTKKIEQIGPAFTSMSDTHMTDPSRPQIEYYRSLNELHLLLPIPKS